MRRIPASGEKPTGPSGNGQAEADEERAPTRGQVSIGHCARRGPPSGNHRAPAGWATFVGRSGALAPSPRNVPRVRPGSMAALPRDRAPGEPGRWVHRPGPGARFPGSLAPLPRCRSQIPRSLAPQTRVERADGAPAPGKEAALRVDGAPAPGNPAMLQDDGAMGRWGEEESSIRGRGRESPPGRRPEPEDPEYEETVT